MNYIKINFEFQASLETLTTYVVLLRRNFHLRHTCFLYRFLCLCWYFSSHKVSSLSLFNFTDFRDPLPNLFPLWTKWRFPLVNADISNSKYRNNWKRIPSICKFGVKYSLPPGSRSRASVSIVSLFSLLLTNSVKVKRRGVSLSITTRNLGAFEFISLFS